MVRILKYTLLISAFVFISTFASLFIVVTLGSTFSHIKYYNTSEIDQVFRGTIVFHQNDVEQQIKRLKLENPRINSFIAYISYDHRFITSYGCLGRSIIGLTDYEKLRRPETKTIWGFAPRGKDIYLEAFAYKYGFEYNKNLARLLGYDEGTFALSEDDENYMNRYIDMYRNEYERR